MAEESNKPDRFELAAINDDSLSQDTAEILGKLITETDANKAKDLTYLFNLNQNKKTAVRLNKQSELLDLLTDQTIARVKNNPDELSNDDLTKLMKTVSDLMERGQQQLSQNEEAPLIQINQQNNEVNMDGKSGQSRESRERVKTAVMEFLKQIGANKAVKADDNGVIDAESKDK